MAPKKVTAGTFLESGADADRAARTARNSPRLNCVRRGVSAGLEYPRRGHEISHLPVLPRANAGRLPPHPTHVDRTVRLRRRAIRKTVKRSNPACDEAHRELRASVEPWNCVEQHSGVGPGAGSRESGGDSVPLFPLPSFVRETSQRGDAIPAIFPLHMARSERNHSFKRTDRLDQSQNDSRPTYLPAKLHSFHFVFHAAPLSLSRSSSLDSIAPLPVCCVSADPAT